MCVLVSAIVGIVAAVGSAVQQHDNQRRQYNYQDRVARQTEANAAQAANSDYLAVSERVVQTREAAAQEAFDASRESDRAQGTLTVGAQAAGITGGTVNDLRFSIAQQAADNVALQQRNASWEEQQIMRAMQDIQNQQQSRLNSAMPSPVQGIDYAGLLGNLGNSLAVYAQDTPKVNGPKTKSKPDKTKSKPDKKGK